MAAPQLLRAKQSNNTYGCDSMRAEPEMSEVKTDKRIDISIVSSQQTDPKLKELTGQRKDTEERVTLSHVFFLVAAISYTRQYPTKIHDIVYFQFLCFARCADVSKPFCPKHLSTVKLEKLNVVDEHEAASALQVK